MEYIEPEDHGPTSEQLLFLPADLPPPTVDPDGVEIEAEGPAALHPLAVEFKLYPHTISECGRYECIGDRRILRRKGTQRVPRCGQKCGT